MSDEIKLAKAAFINLTNFAISNPWGYEDIDKMDSTNADEYKSLINTCRFFYKRDSIVSTVINKMVDIGITDIVINKEGLSANEFRIINALKDSLQEFAESMALEYLISGLVIPEVKFAPATKDVLKEYGIKKYETLTLPVTMWLRDPTTIKINSSMVMDKPSYYVIVPDRLVFFIMNDGKYPDGTYDTKLFQELKAYYPDFINQVRNGSRYVLLDNPYIIRRKVVTGSPYPVLFLESAIESLKHKRNLKRMDYSIASRVISAIQLFKLGNDNFPITEDQEEQFEAVRSQMYWRNTGNKDVERIFQLFANHTLNVEWVFPPVDALLNDKKYAEVNQDIIFSMGFPRILITGEAERTGSSDPEFATMSPIETMEDFRRKIISVINNIVETVIDENNLKGTTNLRFKPINLRNFEQFINAISKLYDTGNLSRHSYADTFGFDLDEELAMRAEEKKQLEKLGIDEYNAQPFAAPGTQQTTKDKANNGGQENTTQDSKKQPDKKQDSKNNDKKQ